MFLIVSTLAYHLSVTFLREGRKTIFNFYLEIFAVL